MSDSGCLSFLLLIFIIYALLTDLSESFSNDHTVYSIHCQDSASNVENCTSDKLLYETRTYTAIPEAQTVLWKDEKLGVRKLSNNCAVINRNNWRCKVDKLKESYHSMKKGEYTIQSSIDFQYVKFVPKWEWLLKGRTRAITVLFE